MVDSAKSSPASRYALPRGLRHFFAWWADELAALLPSGFRHWWQGGGRIVALSLSGERAVLRLATPRGLEDLLAADLPEAGLPLLGPAERQRLVAAAGNGYRLYLALPAEQVLRRQISLPAALAENLRQSLAFEMDRYTPFRAEQVHFDYRLAEAATAATLAVDLAVAPKAGIDPLVARLAGHGLSVAGVAPEADFAAEGGILRNLLPAAAGAPREAPARRRWRAGFAALSLVLLGALLAIPLVQKRAVAVALLPPLAEAKVAAHDADALRDRLNKLVEEHNLLPDRKWESHSPTRLLDELSRLLPDDTFVMQLDFDGKTVQLVGETGAAAGMVETLEASPLLKDVAFKSPLTKIQGTSFDRFQLAAGLEGAGKPAAAAPGGSP